MRIISRWMARFGITGLYVGRSVPHGPPGSLVVFPYEPQKIEELFGLSAEKVSERILAVLRTESAAAIVSYPS